MSSGESGGTDRGGVPDHTKGGDIRAFQWYEVAHGDGLCVASATSAEQVL